MPNPIWINDDDLLALGFRVTRTAGLDSAVPLVPPTVDLPGLGRGTIASVYGVRPPRRFSVALSYRSSVLATLESAMHTLREKLDGSALEFRHLHRTGQRLIARAVSAPVEYTIGPQYVAPYLWQPTIECEAIDPLWKDIAPQSVAFGSVPTPCPTGTAATRPIITVTATTSSVVNPTVTAARANGDTISTMAPTITIAAGDCWQYDGTTGAVRKCVSGTWSNARDTLAVGTVFPVLDPKDGTYALGAFPMLAVSGGFGLATYVREWA